MPTTQIYRWTPPNIANEYRVQPNAPNTPMTPEAQQLKDWGDKVIRHEPVDRTPYHENVQVADSINTQVRRSPRSDTDSDKRQRPTYPGNKQPTVIEYFNDLILQPFYKQPQRIFVRDEIEVDVNRGAPAPKEEWEVTDIVIFDDKIRAEFKNGYYLDIPHGQAYIS